MANELSLPEGGTSIAMGTTVPQFKQSNALELAGQFQGLQKQVMENSLLKMQMLAREKAGEIMANAPSIDEGIAALMQDPMTAGYVPELGATIQGARQSMVATQGMGQEQSISGLQAVIRSVFPALNDPGTFKSSIEAQMQTLSPQARASAEKAVPALVKVLTDGLPEGEAGAEVYQQRLAAMLLGAGITPETIRATQGTIAPQVVETTGPEGEPQTSIIGGPLTGSPIAPSGAGKQVVSQGPTTAQAGAFASEGEVVKEITQDMSANASTIPGTLKRLDMMTDALGKFQAGGGADIRTQIGKIAQGLKNIGMDGITQEMIDNIANGDLAASQEFTANVATFATNALKEAAQGTGRVMRSEVDAFLEMIDQTTDPAAILAILNQAKYALQVGYDESKKWIEFQKLVKQKDPKVDGYRLADFHSWYADNFKPEDLPQATQGGAELGPTPPSEVKGIPSGKGGRPSLDTFFGGQ